MKHGSDQLTLRFSVGLVLVEQAMDDAPEEWGARRTTWAPHSSTGCNLDRAKLVLSLTCFWGVMSVDMRLNVSGMMMESHIHSDDNT
jgi:hypothetical protein